MWCRAGPSWRAVCARSFCSSPHRKHKAGRLRPRPRMSRNPPAPACLPCSRKHSSCRDAKDRSRCPACLRARLDRRRCPLSLPSKQVRTLPRKHRTWTSSGTSSARKSARHRARKAQQAQEAGTAGARKTTPGTSGAGTGGRGATPARTIGTALLQTRRRRPHLLQAPASRPASTSAPRSGRPTVDQSTATIKVLWPARSHARKFIALTGARPATTKWARATRTHRTSVASAKKRRRRSVRSTSSCSARTPARIAIKQKR